MAWADIIDQQRAIETLQRVLTTERLSHAFLFYGPDGIGKRAVAIAFARALLCEKQGDEACGACPSCVKAGHMSHPDIHVLLPSPSDASPDDLAERLQTLASHPYAAIDFIRRPSLSDPSQSSNKQVFYSINRINDELRHTMSFMPVEGPFSIAIISDAEMMRVEAANAFLKLLEEPGPHALFILLTSRIDRMLPTILSRCQRLRFDPLQPESIEQALVERDGIQPDYAASLARMAEGSYTRALELAANEDLQTDRQLLVEYLRFSYTQRIDRLAELIEQVAQGGRERVKSFLRLMLGWVRDLMLFETLGADAPLVNIDQAEAVRKFVQNISKADLEAMMALIEEATELVERNVNLGLTLTTLSQALALAMRGRHDGRLYVPLAEVGETV